MQTPISIYKPVMSYVRRWYQTLNFTCKNHHFFWKYSETAGTFSSLMGRGRCQRCFLPLITYQTMQNNHLLYYFGIREKGSENLIVTHIWKYLQRNKIEGSLKSSSQKALWSICRASDKWPLEHWISHLPQRVAAMICKENRQGVLW